MPCGWNDQPEKHHVPRGPTEKGRGQGPGGDAPVRPGLQIWPKSDGPLRDAAPQVPGMEPTCPALHIRPWVDSPW